MKKALYASLIIILLGAVAGWYYVFVYSKTHHRDASTEVAIKTTAASIVSAYQANEQNANATYLDKAVEVTGKVSEVSKNQANKTTITLDSGDMMSSVFCTLKDSTITVQTGQQVTVKGQCIGFTSDVKIKDAIIVQ